MRRIMPVLFSLALAACTSSGKPMQEPPPNPYARNYVSLMASPASKDSMPPRIYRGRDREADYQSLLEDGYDMLGYSSFEAGDVPPDMLTRQAVQLHADLALVYTRQTGRALPGVKLDQAKSGSGQVDPAAPVGRLHHFQEAFYRYFASYWVRLPPPTLGVHVRRDSRAVETESGLDVIAVIKDSPAAAAGLQRGDTLLRLGEVELRKPETLTQAAQRYAGQSAELVFNRLGEEQHKTVTLNSLQ